jgi:hypothetical protein
MEFYVPSSLSSDFDDMLNTPGFGTAVIINATSATPTTATVQLSNPNFKSNYQNLSDSARILRFSLSDSIKKGDYLTATDDNINYIITWGCYKDLNSYKSQCQICNCQFDFVRWSEAILDSISGETATPAGYQNIITNVDCFTSRTGMGIFDSSASEVGIIPQNRMMVGLQYNTGTALIQIGDEFSFRNIQYEVSDIDYSMLNDTDTTGMLLMYAQKRAGGIRVTV